MTPEQIAKSGSEHAEQVALFAMCALNVGKYPELRWYFAVPNGGLRNKIEAAKLKAEGVKSGVADTVLLVKRGHYSGLLIELKKRSAKPKRLTSKGGVSDEQAEFGAFVNKQGFLFDVCYGYEEAWDRLENYLNFGK